MNQIVCIMTSLVFQATVIQLQHPLVLHLSLTYLPLVTAHPLPTLFLLTHFLPQLVRPLQTPSLQTPPLLLHLQHLQQ